MNTTNGNATFLSGLWQTNPGLVQLLGLCPLLAVTTTLINGLGLGLATIAVLCASNTLVAATRHWIHPNLRLPVYVLLIAGFVSAVDLVAHAWFFDLHGSLGIFIPLIVTNCVILGRAEAFASRRPVPAALADGLGHGLGFAAVLVVLGALREAIGRGTLFAGAGMLFGDTGAALEFRVLPEGVSLPLAGLAPGAFIGLAALVAGRNLLAKRRAARPGNRAKREQ
ncbi:MAG: electron transport complex subunit E [Chromatiales bacterium]|nr:MAG: electron transport complex subunit E [Chromatiales bacterium]